MRKYLYIIVLAVLACTGCKKKVEMTRLADGFTKVFLSQSEAVRWLRENGYPKATVARVSGCANGYRATTYNATWRYL